MQLQQFKTRSELKKTIPWKLLVIFLCFTTAIIIVGISFYKSQRKRIFSEYQNDLSAIASLKTGQIQQWHRERLGDATTIKENEPLISCIKQYFRDKNRSELKAELIRWMKSVCTESDYSSVLLADTSLKVRLSLSSADTIAGEIIGKDLSDVLENHRIIMTDLHKSESVSYVHLDLLVPLVDNESNNKSLAAILILRIDPSITLFPLIQSWPTPSKSSETLIVRKDGDSLLFLNELRHRQNTSLKLKATLSNKNLLGAKAVNGFKGVTEGMDYRNIPVVGYLTGISDSNWFMVAKVDKEEIIFPLKKYLFLIILVVILLILINASIFGFWIWDQQVRFYRKQLQNEEEIKESEEKFITAFQMSPVSITLSSMTNNKFIDVNNTFLKDIEYSREEVIGRTARELNIWANEDERLWLINEISEKGKIFGKVISYRSKTGKIIYGLSSMSVVKLNGEPYNLSTVVNVTETKKAEAKLIESEELYRKLFENMLNGFAYCKMVFKDDQPHDFIYLKVNKAFETLTGLIDVEGKYVSDAIPGIQETDQELLNRYGRVSLTGDPEVFEIFVESLKMWFSISVYSPQKEYFVAVFDVITSRKVAENALKESETLLRNIIDHSNSLIYMVDTEGKFLLVNQPLQSLLSTAGNNLIGQTRESFLPKVIADIHRMNDLEVIQSGKTLSFEEENIESDGMHFYLTTKFPLYNIQHEIYAVGGLSTDITARKNAEEAVRESENKLREAQEMAHLGFWKWDIKSGDVEWSEEVYRIFHLDPEKFKPQIDSILALSPWEEDNHRNTDLINRAIEKHEPGDYEQKFLRPDKSIGYYYSTFQGKYDKNGDLIRIVGTVLDITGRKLAEEALRESEDKFKYIFDHSVIGKSITLPTGEINVNKAFCEMTGYSQAELASTKWQDITHPDDIETNEKMLHYLITGEKDSVRFRKRYIHKNGAVIWTDVGTALRRDKDGTPVYFMTAVVDITERKKAEEIIINLNEELEQKVVQRTELLEAANKELEAFSYSVSHDLRAPLRAVHGYTKILLEEYENKLDEEGKRICGIISSGATQMGELIDDLLNFSRIGRSGLNPGPLDMKSMVRSVFTEISSNKEKSKINLKIGRLHKAFGDANLIRLVWNNLISNAVKYSSKEKISEISISSGSKYENITYSIKDNGVGFDMNYKHKLFGVFQRLHSEAEFEGNGVGLAIVQRIILKHGGKVWAEGEVGKGATFYFSLPNQDKRQK